MLCEAEQIQAEPARPPRRALMAGVLGLLVGTLLGLGLGRVGR